jgi:hypothetical protein
MSEDITLDEARERFAVVRVHAPTLVEKAMRPAFQLINMQCPVGRDGQCHDCDQFKGVDLSETEGLITSYHSYDGFCGAERSDGHADAV